MFQLELVLVSWQKTFYFKELERKATQWDLTKYKAHMYPDMHTPFCEVGLEEAWYHQIRDYLNGKVLTHCSEQVSYFIEDKLRP